MSLYRISKNEPLRKPLTDKCIILDLDETLVHSSEDYLALMELKPFQDPGMLDLRSRMYNLSLAGYDKPPTIWGVVRPYAEDFLLFCFGYFSKVCVWSAGSPEYVKSIVEHIFPAGYKPHAVYNKNHCHYTQSNVLFKPIERMSNDEGWQKSLRLDNTLFLDDRDLAFIKNPDNGIVIPPYEPIGSYESFIQEDQALLDLMDWLMRPEVIRSSDIRLLDKKGIFRIV